MAKIGGKPVRPAAGLTAEKVRWRPGPSLDCSNSRLKGPQDRVDWLTCSNFRARRRRRRDQRGQRDGRRPRPPSRPSAAPPPVLLKGHLGRDHRLDLMAHQHFLQHFITTTTRRREPRRARPTFLTCTCAGPSKRSRSVDHTQITSALGLQDDQGGPLHSLGAGGTRRRRRAARHLALEAVCCRCRSPTSAVAKGPSQLCQNLVVDVVEWSALGSRGSLTHSLARSLTPARRCQLSRETGDWR